MCSRAEVYVGLVKMKDHKGNVKCSLNSIMHRNTWKDYTALCGLCVVPVYQHTQSTRFLFIPTLTLVGVVNQYILGSSTSLLVLFT